MSEPHEDDEKPLGEEPPEPEDDGRTGEEQAAVNRENDPPA
jgi:hypothetical protein